MVTIGIRELRDHFSEYLQKVQDGETIRITKYDQVIARITPSGHYIDESLEELLQQDRVSWSGDKPTGSSSENIQVGGAPASEAVIDDRR